jgi:hypothetical protein
LELLEEILAALPENLSVRLTRICEANREANRLAMQKSREANIPETCEIGSKTAFFGKNGDNSAHSCAGGVGGELCFKHNVTSNIDSKALKANLSKSNPKGNFSKKEKEEFWKAIRERFEPYWICYPEQGRLDYKECLERYNVIKASMPSPTFMLGAIEYLAHAKWNKVKEGYVPKMIKFLQAEDWTAISAKVKRHIEENEADYEIQLERKISLYKGEAK